MVSIEPLPDHVHVDARWIVGGIGRFAANVLPLVLGGGRALGGWSAVTGPRGQGEMAIRFAPLAARGGILLSPGFSPPYGFEHRSIATVHDLHYLDQTIASSRQLWYFKNVSLPRLRRCRLLLTVSEASAVQITGVLGRRAPTVVVVGNGVDPALLDVRSETSGGSPQLLFVGGDKKNKNLTTALTAFGKVGPASNAELVVVGPVAEGTRLAAPAGVTFVGAVDEQRLAQLYANATALLMPSLSEGFGLPALEAMVAGTPVIYGDRDALVEVVGARGWPVDPFDVASVAAGIEAAVSRPLEISDAERRELVDGHRWEDVARRVRDAVGDVL